ncbi:uncharacterized protein N7482_001393 [Penicillium canariense]|uniref:Uncharacterized protein n=1 Tax=Penicillium canariense TaxID=189055 RepID=A0A9W9IH30_9EURO|nr:uncharacterized protein N7482_001393 [Penicillium canariense]KAJ5175516.1 hypothetical protein N7482_001393 [Penicillium canariense]
MADDSRQPCRRRRSSISERIQRALHGDRSDKVRSVPTSITISGLTGSKKHQRFTSGYNTAQQQGSQSQVQPQTRDGTLPQAEAANAHDTSAGFSLQDETVRSSRTYSSQTSRLPSTSTPGSSPSVRPVRSKDEETALQHPATPEAKKKLKDEDNTICSSPTWKDTVHQERRATKRLETERKDLEKRLIQLEKSQARLESGIHERNSRRLTKKQPLDGSQRSSSANSDRPRSARSFTAFFSGSRRSSQSRASSASGNDRRRSSDSGYQAEGSPPTLPLLLPERFGTAVSRELATRHGTTLIPTHQLQHSPRPLHHTPAKSDDLRENWKMAEAWQKQNGGWESGDNLTSYQEDLGAAAGAHPVADTFRGRDNPHPYTPPTHPPPGDLDRERFTASLRHERKVSETAQPPVSRTPQGTAADLSIPRLMRKSPQSQSHPQSAEPSSTRVATARQLNDLAHAHPESAQSPSNVKVLPLSASVPGNSIGAVPKKRRGDPSLHVHQKGYKSSPLSLNSFTTNDIDWKKEGKTPAAPTPPRYNYELVPQPLRVNNYDEPRGRNRQHPSTLPSEMVQTQAKENTRDDHRQSLKGPIDIPAGNVKPHQQRWNPRPMAFDKPQPITADVRPPSTVIPPQKHPGRQSALSENSPYGRTGNESQQIPTILTTKAPATRSQELVPWAHHLATEMPGSISSPNVLNGRGHSRSSSGASSYDTADEEVLDTPNHPADRKGHSHTMPPREPTRPSPPTQYSPPPTREIQITPPSLYGNPPVARDGVIAMMRRTPVQEVTQPQQDQLVAKLFVICCHCRFWHDLPSELYATLACSERLPSESRLVRTFPRRSSLGRRTSLRKSVFGGISADQAVRRLSRGKQGSSAHMQIAKGGAQSGEPALAQVAPLQCCWCGHSMTRSCCQGWTTLVQMRERHH